MVVVVVVVVTRWFRRSRKKRVVVVWPRWRRRRPPGRRTAVCGVSDISSEGERPRFGASDPTDARVRHWLLLDGAPPEGRRRHERKGSSDWIDRRGDARRRGRLGRREEGGGLWWSVGRSVCTTEALRRVGGRPSQKKRGRLVVGSFGSWSTNLVTRRGDGGGGGGAFSTSPDDPTAVSPPSLRIIDPRRRTRAHAAALFARRPRRRAFLVCTAIMSASSAGGAARGGGGCPAVVQPPSPPGAEVIATPGAGTPGPHPGEGALFCLRLMNSLAKAATCGVRARTTSGEPHHPRRPTIATPQPADGPGASSPGTSRGTGGSPRCRRASCRSG